MTVRFGSFIEIWFGRCLKRSKEQIRFIIIRKVNISYSIIHRPAEPDAGCYGSDSNNAFRTFVY